ncbi:hypothetical protein IMF27_16595 [Pseudomonas sp. PCH199]|nr:hypothetical protein [Pseudomonas sp. PCH199]PAM82711.1 hypothetical protein CES87_16935 [Pseudomonas sp. ERMR1:02]
MERLDRAVTSQLEQIKSQIGETDQRVLEEVRTFVGNGQFPKYSVIEELYVQVGALNAADTEQTRESRMQTMLQAGMEWLEAAKGPALNLLNVTGRTGLIVALTEVLRQAAGYHIEQALREGDSSEASRAWAVVAITLIGPALTLIGAIRNECNGTASPASRLGRVGMAVVTLGVLIAAHFNGAINKLLPAVSGGLIYTLVRGLFNAFIPLLDNAGSANVRTTGLSAGAYGAAQFLLAELGQLAPLSGPARAAAGLGYSLGADAIKGLLNGFGMALDDVISILAKSWHVLSPSPGQDSVFFDPESQRQMELKVLAGVQKPTRSQWADALLNIGAMRLSMGHAITLMMSAVTWLLVDSEAAEDDQAHYLIGSTALMATFLYPFLVFGCTKYGGNSYEFKETEVP